jgi:hypothetical protein
MSRTVAALFLAALLAIPFAGPARSATLIIGENALQKLLDSKYPVGRIPLGPQNDCNNPYIETVHITIEQGRVYVTGHLSGHIGGKIAGLCVAPAAPSNFVLSGVPVVSGSVLKMTSIRLDSLERKELEPVIGFLLTNFAGDTVQMNLKPVAEAALKRSALYQIALNELVLQSITVQDKALTLEFDFKLSVQ